MSSSVLLLAVALAAAPVPAAAAAEPVQVLVLGTYHFASPGLDLNNPEVDDVLKPERQRQLEALSDALAEYKPTKILVERVAKFADLVDPVYATFTPADLATERDERVQIAYRLAHRLGHSTVYAIDEQPGDGEPDYFPFGQVAQWAQENDAGERLEAMTAAGAAMSSWIEQLQKEGTIGHALAEMNTAQRTVAGQALYYQLLAIGDTE